MTDNSTASAPAAPATLTCRPSSGSTIVLSWSDVTGENGYVVDYWNGSAWLQFLAVGANTTTAAISNGLGFYYRVGAFNTAGRNYTGFIHASGQASAPAAPSGFRWSSASGRDINLYWGDVTGESGYVIEYWNGSAAVEIGLVGAGVTSSPITNGYGYYFRIGAYNSAGITYTDWLLAE